MGTRRRLTASLALTGVFVLGSCGRGDADDEGATVVRAGQQTMSAGTFRASIETRTFDAADPDRLLDHSVGESVFDLSKKAMRTTQRSVISDGSAVGPADAVSETIRIDSDLWMSSPPALVDLSNADGSDVETKPWRHLTIPGPSRGLGFDPTTLLGELTADGREATRTGRETVRGVPTTRYKIPDVPMEPPVEDLTVSFEVWIDGEGLVRRLRTTSDLSGPSGAEPGDQGRQQLTADLFDFGAEVDIQPPPADQVQELATGCDPGSSATVSCDRTTADIDAGPVELPPPSAAPSTLQLRPVLGTGSACPEATENPDPSAGADVMSTDGECHRLGPAELTIEKASVEVHRSFGELQVDLVLDKADSAALDEVGEAHLGERVAVVMFGRAQSTPEMQTTEFGGRMQITGVKDLQTAANIKASLDP